MRARTLIPIGIVIGAVGIAVGLALPSERLPRALESATDDAVVPVERVEFDGAAPAEVSLDLGSVASAHVAASGTVTASDCVAGSEIAPWTSQFALDGRPLVTVVTSVPLWRDLQLGDVGDDVEALRTALHAAGYAIHPTGAVDPSLIAIVNRLLAEHGSATEAEAIHRSSLVWMPKGTRLFGECPSAIGDVVVAGDVIARLQAPVVQASVALAANRPLRHEQRVVDVDGRTFTLDSGGRLRDPGRIRYTPASGADEAKPHVLGTVRLAKKRDVGVVPPSSVITGTSAKTCVIVGGVRRTVTVVGSQLGRTFVLFSGAQDPRTVVARPDRTLGCSP